MPQYVDRFCAALSVLAGSGHIKQRLIEAFEQHLQDIDSDALPLSSREMFADIRFRITQVPPLNGEGPIRASVRKMSVLEADQCARQLVSIYTDVVRNEGDAQVQPPLATDDAPTVPAMLLKSV